jgi:hypothetical protein
MPDSEKCKYCGQINSLAAKYCISCGHPFEDIAPSKASRIEFFEFSRPRGDGLCSDDACPCDPGGFGDIIPRGTGYLWISSQVVEFHRGALSKEAAIQKYKAANPELAGARVIVRGYGPVLMCRIGAEQLGIDLKAAAADAEFWWETGLVPLRPT